MVMRMKTQRPPSTRRKIPARARRPLLVSVVIAQPIPSRGLLLDDLLVSGLVELRRQRLVDAMAESLFQKLTGLTAFTAGEALGLDAGLSGR